MTVTNAVESGHARMSSLARARIARLTEFEKCHSAATHTEGCVDASLGVRECHQSR
jgi:hypothetical protein